LSLRSRPFISGGRAAHVVRFTTTLIFRVVREFIPASRRNQTFAAQLATLVLTVALSFLGARAQTLQAEAEVPDAAAFSTNEPAGTFAASPANIADIADLPQAPSPQQTTPPPPPQDDQQQKSVSGVATGVSGQSDEAKEQLKKQEKQRVLGVIPAFNSVYEGKVPPLTPGQKMKLMFKSTTDVYVFAFAAVTAGIGQAQDSHAAYGQGMEGYAKRFGANYADTADGNFWGNAILPIVLHEDPRYFRLGTGTFTHRLLYSMSTTVWCHRDNGTTGPNYANVLGNLIAGGISNVYYPEADRGLGNTLQNAATVTAEGMIGAALIEFWPDIAEHYHKKRQAKRDAAAAAAGHGTIAVPAPAQQPPPAPPQ
jgi:hypothetical protein